MKRLSKQVGSRFAIAVELHQRRAAVQPRHLRIRLAIQRYLDEFGRREVVSVMLLIGLVYLHSCLWPSVLLGPVDSSHFNSTIAEIVGAFLGILFAIVVFSVQLHAGESESAAIAVPFLVRLHRIYPILAFGLGITLGNIGVLVAVDLFPQTQTAAASVLNLIGVPLLFIFSAGLIWITLRDAPRVPHEQLFRRDMLFELAESLRQRRMTEELRTKCAKYLINTDYPKVQHSTNRSFMPRRSGVVTDIDLNALHSLAGLVRSLSPDITIHLLTEIGQRHFPVAPLHLVGKMPPSANETPARAPAISHARDDVDDYSPAIAGDPLDPSALVDDRTADIQKVLDALLIISDPPVTP